jgi:hypothetical protein
MYEPGPPRRRGDADALSRFLDYLREIEQALARRDAMRVTALLRKRTATHLPREVREELLMLARESRDSVRAPVRFLRFQRQMQELTVSGEGLLRAQVDVPTDEVQDGVARRRTTDELRPAASDPLDDY